MTQAQDLMKDIIGKCAKLNLYEKRSVTESYCELVFLTNQTDEWGQILSDVLGEAVKPSNQNPTSDDLTATKEYGGICANQTLFKKSFDGQTIIAMFWPWGDQTHTTLKIAIQ